MDELYEHLKIIDYSLICFLNKYRIIHKYIKYILDIFVNVIDEYNRLIHKIICVYKQNIYNSVHNNFTEFKNNEEKQREQDKNISEIKENLKRATKLTKTNLKFKGEKDEQRDIFEIDPNLKIHLPYNALALYRLRHYRNLFFKKHSTISKNDNYLNANEQRKKFLEKLKASAKVNNDKAKERNDIFKDDYKNMLRIVNDNYFFKESQTLKEILIINKYLIKARNIVNNVPQFLCTIIEDFELTESTFQDNMYLFILLALNKWLKKIIHESERFISYGKGKVYKKKVDSGEEEIYKKHSEYLNDILQRGAEQTNVFNDEKCFYVYPDNMKFNINTSFLTYYFLYINKNLFDFLDTFYTNSIKRRDGKENIHQKEKIKLIIFNDKKEESIYMKSDIYNYNLHNEYTQVDYLNNLSFYVDGQNIYPNVFLICNYLLQEETKNIMSSIHKIQRNSFRFMLYQDISIIIQMVLRLLDNLKIMFKQDVIGDKDTGDRGNRYEENWGDKNRVEKSVVEENYDDKKGGDENKASVNRFIVDRTDEDSPKGFLPNDSEEWEQHSDKYEYMRKYISRNELSFHNSTTCDKFLVPLRLMLLNILKFVHTTTQSYDRRTICIFWQKLSENENKSTHMSYKTNRNLNSTREENISTGEKDTYMYFDKNQSDYSQNLSIPLRSQCNEDNCYHFNSKNKKNIQLHLSDDKENINKILQQRILYYDFYKIVSEHVKKVKLQLENTNNRDLYTGILLKKINKYKIDSEKKTMNYSTTKKNYTHKKNSIIQNSEGKRNKLPQQKKSITRNMSITIPYSPKLENKNNVIKKRNENKNMPNVIAKNIISRDISKIKDDANSYTHDEKRNSKKGHSATIDLEEKKKKNLKKISQKLRTNK
ncbi:conserved Plasmodium protein, unknown function [Plasmodium malariae]|uniref:Uncharacterized protein n=1 Tax=Plasmodium malariae TaxID=5858 RepID=A0A1D3JMP1_PLAMA|nr:conserved Plasmodium protein, unknown function [Plasmodium malariae]SBT87927.1 conserved Plasmodium protein, unknown function [Plasmodium malariae]